MWYDTIQYKWANSKTIAHSLFLVHPIDKTKMKLFFLCFAILMAVYQSSAELTRGNSIYSWIWLVLICFSHHFLFTFLTRTEEICALPMKNDFICRGAFPSYFHNSATGKCEYFLWSGCGTNENRFDLEEQCIDYCIKKTTDKRSK